ncbi:pentatricopeptide repeat-containing protein At5g04780, mitochondrial-like [Aristolochia californica]|uniref:pentatricopeptide repeat-containing protein At5g04780, mitochondrial-like n=1 Tax=Aristolochia californica TaxID=171875 RepID=UPI0035E354AB
MLALHIKRRLFSYLPAGNIWRFNLKEKSAAGCFSSLAFSKNAWDAETKSRNSVRLDNHFSCLDYNFYDLLLQSCNCLKRLKQLHSFLATNGFIQFDPRLGARIITQYSILDDMQSAYSLFLAMERYNCSFLWNAMIRAYSTGGFYDETIDVYLLMREKGLQPDNYTYPILLKAFAHNCLITEGKLLHSHLLKNGFEMDSIVNSGLMSFYAKCGEIEYAGALFVQMSRKDIVCWNTIITGFEQLGRAEESLAFFRQMQLEGPVANLVTIVGVTSAVTQMRDARMARSVHAYAVRNGFESNVFLQSALVAMYSKCAEVSKGRKLFDRMVDRDLVCWNVMIAAYEKSEQARESLELFHKMQQDGFLAGPVTMVSVASAIGQLGDDLRARSVHAKSIRNEFLDHVNVGNSVIAMYGKCGLVKIAQVVFYAMKRKDTFSWNSILSGYTQNGFAKEALLLFDQMLGLGFGPDSVTMLNVVGACSYLGSLHLARGIHGFIFKRIEIGTTLKNAIVDLYCKCGDLEAAVWIFNDNLVSGRNVCTWNVMISGYGNHGRGKEALELFSRMQKEGIEPNDITFTSILSACSHAGLIEEGRRCFSDIGKMVKKFHKGPLVIHYACMVDMLGRAGLLSEASDLIAEMPIEPNSGVWGALLGACRIHGNAELGEFAAKNLFQVKPQHTGYHILLSNIYATSNRWHELEELRYKMHNRGLRKPAAFSVIEFRKEVHGFYTADQSHPQHREVYRRLESLLMELKMAGYAPDRSCVLHDVEEEDKELILSMHSEKLAVAFGTMCIDEKMPLQVTKDVRICNDCHSAIKLISKVYKRRIIVRDVNRFHHFEDGWCSCKDYW